MTKEWIQMCCHINDMMVIIPKYVVILLLFIAVQFGFEERDSTQHLLGRAIFGPHAECASLALSISKFQSLNSLKKFTSFATGFGWMTSSCGSAVLSSTGINSSFNPASAGFIFTAPAFCNFSKAAVISALLKLSKHINSGLLKKALVRYEFRSMLQTLCFFLGFTNNFGTDWGTIFG